MRVFGFPGCCTAKILTGFGQTETAEYAFRPENPEPSVEELKKEFGSRLNAYTGGAMFVVITNDEQVNANKALQECGFHSSYWMSKNNHPDTKVKLWWFPLEEKQING
jgi:hypothetical protein